MQGRLMWWIRFLNWIGWRKDSLTCISQQDTFRWSAHLGKQTKGTCDQCGTTIYYEEQNGWFPRKICNRCDPRWSHLWPSKEAEQ